MRDNRLLLGYFVFFLVISSIYAIAATCSDGGLSFTAENNGQFTFGLTKYVQLQCDGCSGAGPADKWGIYDNATIFIDTNYLNNLTSSLKDLSAYGTNFYRWTLNGTALVTNTTVNVTVVDENNNECTLSVNINVTNALDPNITITIVGLDGLVLHTAYNYTFNVTFNNTGNGSAQNILGAFTYTPLNASSFFNLNVSTISVSSVSNGTTFIVSYLLTPLISSRFSNLTLTTSITSMDKADGTAVTINASTVTNDATNFTIWLSPTWSALSNITVLMNNNDSSLILVKPTLDAENVSNLTLGYVPVDNLTITINSSSHIVKFVPQINWTGARNITFNATDIYNVTVNSSTFLFFVHNSTTETCDGIDEDGDTLIDETSVNTFPLTRSGCCPVSQGCDPGGTETCSNGAWGSCTGYTAKSTGGGGGSSGTSISTITTPIPEPEPTPPPKPPEPEPIPEPPKESGGEAVKTEEQLLIQKIADNRIKHTRQFFTQGGRTKVIEKIKNIDLFNLEDVKVTLEAPKSVITNTDEIIRVTPFTVIEYDPKIRFNLGDFEVKEEKVIEYVINKQMTAEEVKQIILNVDLPGITNLKEREELFNKTQEVINITTTAKVDIKRNETEFTLDIDFKNDTILYDTYIYSEIPKCLVEIIEEIMIDSELEFDIVSKDPLIVWHFKKLVKGDQLRYIIKSIADENCLNQVKTYVIARQIVLLEAPPLTVEEQISKIWFPLMSIILLVAVLFVLAGYTGERKSYIRKLNEIRLHTKKKYEKGFLELEIRTKLQKDGYSLGDILAAMEYEHKNRLVRFINNNLFGGEILFLFILVILNIMDFFKVLPGDMDFLKKIISWTLLSYLLYEASLTKALFGTKKFSKLIDFSLLFLYFSLIFKIVIEFAKNSFSEAVFFKSLLVLIAKYSIEANNISLYIGFIGLMLISLFITFSEPVRKPSFYHVFTSILGKHKIEGKNKWLEKTVKLISVYIVLLLFYIVFYNFIFEWLTIAIDASLLVVVLIVTLWTFLRREYHLIIGHKIKNIFKIKLTEGIEKIMAIADAFNVRFFHLLPYRRFVYLAVIGILVLHLVTEAGIFILPYVTGAVDPTYFAELGGGHTPVFNLAAPLQAYIHKEMPESLLALQTEGLDILSSIAITIIYIMNVFAIFFLLINPMIIWLHMYKNREEPAHLVKPIGLRMYKIFQLLFIISIAALLLTPIFRISYASKKIFGETEIVSDFESSIRGLDIQTRLIENVNLIYWVLGISIFLGLIYLMFRKRRYRQITSSINTVNLLLIVAYLSFFYIDIQRFFINTLKDLFAENIFFFLHFGLFFIMSALFYLIGIAVLSLELFIRGEIFMPHLVIKIARFFYSDLEEVYHHLFPHHHLPHLIFYEHHIELEHGTKEEHLFNYVKKYIYHVYDNKSLLKHLFMKYKLEKGHELDFVKEHLLEHNWPEELAERAIKRAMRDSETKKQVAEIRRYYAKAKAEYELSEAVKKLHDAGHPLEDIVLQARKKGWKKEDIKKSLLRLKLKRKYKVRIKRL